MRARVESESSSKLQESTTPSDSFPELANTTCNLTRFFPCAQRRAAQLGTAHSPALLARSGWSAASKITTCGSTTFVARGTFRRRERARTHCTTRVMRYLVRQRFSYRIRRLRNFQNNDLAFELVHARSPCRERCSTCSITYPIIAKTINPINVHKTQYPNSRISRTVRRTLHLPERFLRRLQRSLD